MADIHQTKNFKFVRTVDRYGTEPDLVFSNGNWDLLDNLLADLTSNVSTPDLRNQQIAWFQPIKGVNAIFNTSADDNKLPDSLLDQLKTDGVNTIFLCTTLSVTPSVTGTAVAVQYPAAKLKSIYDRVKAKGFKVAFKPHVGLNGTGSGGSLVPSDVPTFLNNYQTAVSQYVSAEAGMVFDYVFVSNECVQFTNGNLPAWTSFISWIRTKQASAKITVACTYDELSTNVFLSLVDVIGLNAYPQLQDLAYPNTTPSLNDCLNAWHYDRFNESFIPTLQSINARYGKQIIISEVGVIPYKEALKATALWDSTGMTYDEDTQALWYQSALESLGTAEYLDGVSFWSITDGFTFVGRKAEAVVQSFWGGAV